MHYVLWLKTLLVAFFAWNNVTIVSKVYLRIMLNI